MSATSLPQHSGAAAHLPGGTGSAAGLAATASAPDRTAPGSTGETVVEASGVCKYYQIGGERQTVLDHVNFRAEAKECVFLTGPSGSGKSTLLSILGCLLGADAGSVTIAGQRVDNLSTAEQTLIRRNSIGFVFQRFQLIRGLTAEDNIALPLTLQGTSLEEAREQARTLLKRVRLEQHRHALPSAMSPGQCQRVALARAVITAPKLLLADEPTAALDSTAGAEVMQLLMDLVQVTGSATVVVTHDPRIYQFADRVCELANGTFT